MARSIRIQYEGAYYHVTARGNHREAIFLDDEDRKYFLETLGDVCEMTGWRVHAWVLMGNHYHLFIETPEANLVEGMKWFQNTYTRRFNVRHKLWGRLFGDRYKAVLVEGGSTFYYETLMDYIHLNPVRATLIKVEQQESVLDYHWSSLAQGYAIPSHKRKAWMACAVGLKMFGFSDTTAGSQKMVDRLNHRMREEAGDRCGLPLTVAERDKRCSHFSRGWYWGTQEFSKKVFLLAEETFNKQRSRIYHSAEEHKAHGLQQAEAWYREAIMRAKLNQDDLNKLNGSDPRKIFIALFLKKKTTVSNSWLAEKLKMKSPAHVSNRLSKLDKEKLKMNLPTELIEYVMSQGFEI
jgi:REP element-mobilizing transposase RayT